MKALTTTEYDVKQLCAEKLNGIAVKTFKNNPERYLKIIEEDYEITIRIGAYKKRFYSLKPKVKKMTILTDSIVDTSELKRADLKKVDLILKAVLNDKVIPTHEDIAEAIGYSSKTVQRTLQKMYVNGILLEPNETLVEDSNKYTGEIYDYMKRNVSWIYYDILKDGSKIVLDFPNIHSIYSEYFSDKYVSLRNHFQSSFDRQTALNVASFHAQKETNKTFGLNNVQKKENLIVAEEYKQLVKRNAVI